MTINETTKCFNQGQTNWTIQHTNNSVLRSYEEVHHFSQGGCKVKFNCFIVNSSLIIQQQQNYTHRFFFCWKTKNKCRTLWFSLILSFSRGHFNNMTLQWHVSEAELSEFMGNYMLLGLSLHFRRDGCGKQRSKRSYKKKLQLNCRDVLA